MADQLNADSALLMCLLVDLVRRYASMETDVMKLHTITFSFSQAGSTRVFVL